MYKKITAIVIILTLCMGMSACRKEKAPAVSGTAPAVSGTASAPKETDVTQEQVHETETTENDFDGEVVDGGFVLKRCNSDAKEIVVPETIQGAPVVRIGKNAFAQLHCESVVLPSSVTEIDDEAFFECSELKNVELGNGLRRMGKVVFIYCKNLESVRFPESLVKIEGVLFHECDALSEVYIPASVTDIPEGIAFIESCPNLVIVTPAGSVAEQVAKEAGIPVRNE